MTQPAGTRDELHEKFGRAFFRQDLSAPYEVVTEDFVTSQKVQALAAPQRG